MGALAVAFAPFAAGGLVAQEAPGPDEAAPAVSLVPGVQVVSRHIYRGLELGDAVQIQPSLVLTAGRWEIAVWGSHPLTEDRAEGDLRPYKEAVAWLSYSLPLGESGGTLIPYVQNHYNVNRGDYLDGDAHQLQAQLTWLGPARVPVDLTAGWVFANDPDESVWLEAGWTFVAGNLAVRAFVGGTPGESAFHGTDEAALTQLGVSTGWNLRLSESTVVPLSLRFVLNPDTGELYPVFGFAL